MLIVLLTLVCLNGTHLGEYYFVSCSEFHFLEIKQEGCQFPVTIGSSLASNGHFPINLIIFQ